MCFLMTGIYSEKCVMKNYVITQAAYSDLRAYDISRLQIHTARYCTKSSMHL